MSTRRDYDHFKKRTGEKRVEDRKSKWTNIVLCKINEAKLGLLFQNAIFLAGEFRVIPDWRERKVE